MLTARDWPASSLGETGGRNKMQGKLRAAHHQVLDLDPRAVQFGDTLHDRQPQPRTALAVAVTPPEPVKDQIALLVRDAGAAVLHGYRAVLADHEFDDRILWRVADRVFGEVTDRPLDHLGIALDENGRGCTEQRDLAPLFER